MSDYTLGFVLEQSLGHVTHTRNLQSHLLRDQEIDVHWCLVPWQTHGWQARLPLYGSNWTVRAGLRARTAIRNLVETVRLDALFIHTQVPAILSADWLWRVPSVISLDATPLQIDDLGRAYQHQRGPVWAERVKRALNQHCFRAARHLVTWSEWAKRGLVDLYDVPAEKITVIAPGVSVDEWSGSTPRHTHDRPLRILFVGADFARKGGSTLLQSFRELGRSDVELHVVTRQALPDVPGLRVYHDMQPNSAELRRLYQQSDIFCLPTQGDCLPMVLAEAGAAGLPIVSTPIAAIPEVVRDGETGLLVPPEDPAALATALRRLIDDETARLQMGRRVQELVRRDHDVRRNARRLLEVLKRTADTSYRVGRAA